jgi:transaldolase
LEYESVNEVHVPSWGLDSDEIWKNGIVLAKNDPQRIVVAVPCTFEGVKAANALVADGARVQISGVFAPHQALMAAAIGASYVAPTFGKMYDAGRDGFKATEEMMKTITKCGSESKILVKNVRSAVDLANLGSIGCDTFAISAEVCEDMFSDSLTAQYNKELNLTVARIGEKQRDLKLEAQKQKLLEMEKQSMPVQDDPESENDSVGATKTTTKVVAAGTTTTSGGENNNNNNNNIVSLEEMPKEVFVESDAADKSGGDNDGSSKGSVDSNDLNVIDSDDFTRKEFDP